MVLQVFPPIDEILRNLIAKFQLFGFLSSQLPNLEINAIETWFSQLHYLPLTYLIILMWVVVANVLARIICPLLINQTSGSLNRILKQRVPVSTTSDQLICHLFEKSILSTLNVQLLFTLSKDISRLMCVGISSANCTEYLVPEKILIPEKYWSGCPPRSI